MSFFIGVELHGETIDSLSKNRIRYFSPGNGGQNKVWDFSKKLNSKGSAQVMFITDSTGVVSVIETGKISYYRTTPDTLILFGSESPLEKRDYIVEKKIRRFPLEYGDSISEGFRCEGIYCGNHLFREVGTTTIRVDAVGSIVLAENDTVRNVRRVHTIDAYSICMDIDSTALDTAKLTQIIDERYEWYLPQSKYPMIEDVTSTSYYNLNVVGTTKYAYCNLPADQVSAYITQEDDSTDDEQEGFSDQEPHSPDIIHYTIESQGKVVNMTYSLDEDATITTIVSNHIGMLCMSRQWTQNAGQGYSAQIDCNGLPSGIYILYINVNGKVYSEKVTL
ncbi:MAG: hypothetical protein II407_03860 [Prevotella sp.]|nr:hypothetical protein [Prevotella sp.]